MSKEREVYAERAEVVPTLNPFVEMPRMRVSAVNRLNELIEKNTPKPMVKHKYFDGTIGSKCPRCNGIILPNEFSYCPYCGQRIDTENYEL